MILTWSCKIFGKMGPQWMAEHLSPTLRFDPFCEAPLASTIQYPIHPGTRHGSATNYPLASATTLQQPKPTLTSATKPQQPKLAYQNPTPLWQVHAQSHLTRHIIWFLNHSLRSIVYGSWFTKHSLRVIVYESWFTKHSLRILVLLELFDLTALHFVQGFFLGLKSFGCAI